MKRRLLPLVLLLALSGCARNAVVSHLAVSGVVGGAVPVAGVPVTATDHAGHRTVSGVTDAQGRYALVLDGPGPFVLTAPFNDDDGTPATLSATL
ncbi:MAG: carboxypeptidase regulatory-like domain-containing protein, partial [Xanthomonadaceae bacterium]|nr:carboxypeptidase regulatory-like domain-containing protein [Xanthomonadaceae bacterium]